MFNFLSLFHVYQSSALQDQVAFWNCCLIVGLSLITLVALCEILKTPFIVTSLLTLLTAPTTAAVVGAVISYYTLGPYESSNPESAVVEELYKTIVFPVYFAVAGYAFFVTRRWNALVDSCKGEKAGVPVDQEISQNAQELVGKFHRSGESGGANLQGGIVADSPKVNAAESPIKCPKWFPQTKNLTKASYLLSIVQSLLFSFLITLNCNPI
ncbi:MAG: hypothetical protein PHO46_11120 [Thermoguttaceae bacterium]|jgi:hypothetical protein|nr:hypothetical protein [Thermoguttaceae bacterium]